VSIVNRLNIRATVHYQSATPGRDPATGDEQSSFDASRDWSTMCDLRQQTSRERRGGGLVVTVTWLLFMLPDVPTLGAEDEIDVDGMGRWAIEGDPWLVKNPRTGQALHWLGTVRKVD
jgi:hypothetical protein